jgi:hypothetical protein
VIHCIYSGKMKFCVPKLKIQIYTDHMAMYLFIILLFILLITLINICINENKPISMAHL